MSGPGAQRRNGVAYKGFTEKMPLKLNLDNKKSLGGEEWVT